MNMNQQTNMLSHRRKQSVSPHRSPKHRHAQDEHRWFMFFTALELLSTAQSIGDAAACMRAFALSFSSLDLRIGSAVVGGENV